MASHQLPIMLWQAILAAGLAGSPVAGVPLVMDSLMVPDVAAALAADLRLKVLQAADELRRTVAIRSRFRE